MVGGSLHLGIVPGRPKPMEDVANLTILETSVYYDLCPPAANLIQNKTKI